MAAAHRVDVAFFRFGAFGQQRQQVFALHLGRYGQSRRRQACRRKVHIRHHRIGHRRRNPFRPAYQQRYLDSVFIERSLGHELRPSVVAHEDDNRVLRQPVVVQVLQYFAEIRVQPVYFIVVGSQIFAYGLRVRIEFRQRQRRRVVEFRRIVGVVRVRVGELQEEGFVLVAPRHERAELVVDLSVAGSFPRIGHNHARVQPLREGFVAVVYVVLFHFLDSAYPAAHRAIQMIATARYARVVALFAQILRKCTEAARQRHIEARHVHRHRAPARHDRRTRGYALRRGRIGAVEAHALRREAVQIRRHDVAVAVAAHRKCALVVAQHQQDVRLFGLRRRASAQYSAAQQHAGFQLAFHFFVGLAVSRVSRNPVRKITVVPNTMVR